ncbi:MAG: hypothetical protein AMJ78_04480 [Omnitrophica WOR_2 bacterium SM23_29]|nr:MAG: hypothetical protein AMJ78_04480 [Omnitrophica WOR_2 bacterium SM23_29]
MKKSLFFVFAIVALISCYGCGYSIRSLTYSRDTKIYIKPFENKVDLNIAGEYSDRYTYKLYRHRLETKITDAVINRFLLDGYLKVVSNEAGADLVMNGELTNYEKQPLRYDDQSNIEEYRANLIVNITLRDTKKDVLLWQENGFVGYSEFFTTGGQAKSEDAAIDDAVEDLARRIIERTVEDW